MIVECTFCHAAIDTESDDFIYYPETESYFCSADCCVQQLFNEDSWKSMKKVDSGLKDIWE